jgi:hypothetical protein
MKRSTPWRRFVLTLSRLTFSTITHAGPFDPGPLNTGFAVEGN